MSVGIVSNISDMQDLAKRLAALESLDREALLEGLGAETENQTRRRIGEEKTAPDGTPWPEWSPRYAKTRNAGQSLLEGEGALMDSLQSVVTGDEVETGSNLIYAAIHNLGGTEEMPPGPRAVPARQYLGFSDENQDELQQLTDDFVEAHLKDILK